jgi:hypothetical protein
MRSNAAPGPDGLNAAFYKASWDWIANDVYDLVASFYRSGYLPAEINYTHITLIPKINAPLTPKDYRPISLCNVAYKIIAKSLADRIRNHLPHIIHPSQTAFVQGRYIASNIIIAQEIIHSFNLKSWKQKAFFLKIDLAKAFDRIEWNFIVKALKRQGFHDHFVDLIYKYISTTTLSVIINGESTPSFHPQRGLRQGCPLSPYLFIIAVNELSICLQQHSDTHNIQGVTLGPNCPKIHSLLFADDLIICGQATQEEANKINSILQNFCNVSGQTPNLAKSSIMFSRNADNSSRVAVKSVFPVPDLTPNTIYLGHPLIFNHNDRAKAYDYILNKFKAKLTILKANKLNHAGHLVYINSVLASIPIYYMSTILFSKAFISKITTIIRNFWWAGAQEDNSTSPFHFRSWSDICKPKKEGGLGIRDLLIVNRSLILHAAWNVATGKNPFLSNILKAKYFPNDSFWTARDNNIKSAFWSSIWQIKNILIDNCTVQIQKGDFSIWSTPWCSIWKEIHSHLRLPVTVPNLPHNISELWTANSHDWDINFISQVFDTAATTAISNVITVPSNDKDEIKWKPAPKGNCTSREAFKLLNSQMQVHLPTQGSRSVTTQSMEILRRVWAHKSLSPNMKTFTWRLIRRAIATGVRAGSLSTKINKNCEICNKLENDSHLFFHCSFARAVWFSSKTPLRTSLLPFE